MSRAAQDDFEETIAYVSGLEPVKGLSSVQNARRIVRDWVAGSKHVKTTVASISEQLRRYVDENFLEEERHISQIMKQIEASAIAICNQEKPPVQMELLEADLTYGNAEAHADNALYSHISVNRELLKQHILDCLEKQQSVTLAQIVEAYPIRLGLAELVTYLVIAKGEWNAVIDTETRDPILWKDKMGRERCANLVRVVYTYDNIKTRIEDINQSLFEIDYNAGRYIKLNCEENPDAEIKEFRAKLKACTEEALSVFDKGSHGEEKFYQVREII